MLDSLNHNMETNQIDFNPQSLIILNVILGFVLFGIALELKKEDFMSLITNRKSSIVGLVSHFLLLPLLTFGLVKLLQPPPAIGLGMILVGACPGGNISNMFTHIAKGNTALAVGLTSLSHVLAIVMTPLNFSFYGSLDASTASILKDIHLSIGEVLQTVVVVIGIPLIAGMVFRYYKPTLADKLMPYMKKFSLIAFAFFLIAAFIKNRGIFIANLTTVFPLVVLHNILALSAGYLFARLVKLPTPDARTITFETGVQNSALGLILIFTFFGGMAGMAIVAALWGIWHLVTGGGLALWWGRQAKTA